MKQTCLPLCPRARMCSFGPRETAALLLPKTSSSRAPPGQGRPAWSAPVLAPTPTAQLEVHRGSGQPPPQHNRAGEFAQYWCDFFVFEVSVLNLLKKKKLGRSSFVCSRPTQNCTPGVGGEEWHQHQCNLGAGSRKGGEGCLGESSNRGVQRRVRRREVLADEGRRRGRSEVSWRTPGRGSGEAEESRSRCGPGHSVPRSSCSCKEVPRRGTKSRRETLLDSKNVSLLLFVPRRGTPCKTTMT